MLCYAALHTVLWHRLSHALWTIRLPAAVRFSSHLACSLTGIEIHPGARLGRRLFIDHGMGVVVGETAEVGNDVLIYHGVTLGGLSGQPGKRHPTLEDNVTAGAGAQVLGPIRIGRGARVGANAVVVAPVAAGCTVVGIPARPPRGQPCQESVAVTHLRTGLSERRQHRSVQPFTPPVDCDTTGGSIGPRGAYP
jgi:serine O-acetyltransferase